MIIAQADLFTYRLLLKQPLVLRRNTITERRGLLIKLMSETGAVGWGDVAPLPGYSKETWKEARVVLLRLQRGLAGTSISTDDSELSAWPVFGGLQSVNVASVRCGVEMAALNLLATETGCSVAELLSDNPADEILLNGLITDDEDPIRCAQRLKYEGFRTVKLKVGQSRIADDVERVRQISRELGAGVALRLDANRAWEFDGALSFAEQIADCEIEYIEEPLSNPRRLRDYAARTNLPVALDESVLDLTADDLRRYEYAAAVVLKPTLLGGLEKAGSLARIARELGMKVVVSSSFESGVGIAALAQFAAAYGQPGVAVGLDTLDRFHQDVLMEPIDTSGGRILIKQAWAMSRSVNKAAIYGGENNTRFHHFYHWSQLEDDFPLLRDGDLLVTGRRVLELVEMLSTELADFGCRPGSRIAVIENNRIELPLLLLACLRARVVAALISPRYPEITRKAMINSTGCRGVATWGPPASGTAPYGVEEIVVPSIAEMTGIPDAGYNRFRRRLITNLLDRGTIVFTSGSTGPPKAVLHSVGNHLCSALGSNAVLPVAPGDRWLLSLPLYHVGGLGILFRCILGGATVVFERQGVDMADQVAQDKITHLSLVPTQLRRLLRHPDISRLGLTLKAILLGGGPIPPDLLKEAAKANLPVYPSYGLSEMTSQVATGSPGKPDKLRILPHREVMIADDGTICVQGNTLFLGYVEPQDVKLPTDIQGWFRTGDVGRIDSRGYLHVRGRRDNMFVSGGENIHPEQVEEALTAVAGINEAIVVPVEDREYGQRPVAFVRYDESINLSDPQSMMSESERFRFDYVSLSNELSRTLPRFMIPVAIYPWPHDYEASGIKADRRFFHELAAKLRRSGK